MENLFLIISKFYTFLGFDIQANWGDLWALIFILIFITFALSFLLSSAPTPSEEIEEIGEIEEKEEKKVKEISWGDRLKKGLAKSREEIWGKIDSVLGDQKLDKNKLETIEEILYSSDLGPTLVGELLAELEGGLDKKDISLDDLKKILFEFMQKKIEGAQGKVDDDLYNFKKGDLKVILIVGVNGVGKTTTIGKLATKYSKQGASVFVGACDTFRAAAVDQLQVWCDRAGAKMIRAKSGSDPSGVAYETLKEAQKEGADYCILDTAGRLHTKTNLMEELKKNKRVLKKLNQSAPQHILLVLDAITGQNALKQAQEFHKALGLTGLIFTKCDGSSKAGSAIPIIKNLNVPVAYIGVGESVEDLNKFNTKDYLDTLLNVNT